MVAGGDRVHYPGNSGTPTADLLTIKILNNSIISTAGTKIMTMDTKDFYLNTLMARYKYMQLRIADMPDDVIEHYNLRDKATPNGFIYCEMQKGMYGLPQAGIIASNFSRNACINMATVKARQPQAYGSTTLVPKTSPWLSTTLE